MIFKKITNYLLIITVLFGLYPIFTLAQTAEIDLIYEIKSYTPPFYKGRALNPNQGAVLVTAIPNFITTDGTKLSNKEITFVWKKSDFALNAFSGLGKNTFTFSGRIPIRDSIIEVTAINQKNNLQTTKKINITNDSPKIIFYENNPIYGIMFNKAITDTVKLTADEFSVLAIPYFFSIDKANNADLTYDWSMNGRKVNNQEPINSFTTRIEAPGSGTAGIGLKISNKTLIFQFTDNNYRINFSKK